VSVTKTYKCDLCREDANHPMDLTGLAWKHRPDLERTGIGYENPHQANTHICAKCWEDIRTLPEHSPF
jgi:hypothetical protein